MHLWPSLQLRDSFKVAYLRRLEWNLQRMKLDKRSSSSSNHKLLDKETPNSSNESNENDGRQTQLNNPVSDSRTPLLVPLLQDMLMLLTCCYCCFGCGDERLWLHGIAGGNHEYELHICLPSSHLFWVNDSTIIFPSPPNTSYVMFPPQTLKSGSSPPYTRAPGNQLLLKYEYKTSSTVVAVHDSFGCRGVLEEPEVISEGIIIKFSHDSHS